MLGALLVIPMLLVYLSLTVASAVIVFLYLTSFEVTKNGEGRTIMGAIIFRFSAFGLWTLFMAVQMCMELSPVPQFEEMNLLGWMELAISFIVLVATFNFLYATVKHNPPKSH